MGKENKLVIGLLYLFCTWIVLAMTFDIGMLVLSATNPKLEERIGNEISWRIDGAFSHLPENIWYQSPSIAIGMINNKVKIGPIAGNRKLEFGVKIGRAHV